MDEQPHDPPVDAGRYTDLKMTLRLTCPNCQSAGLVAWEQLDRVVICRKCDSWYRVENTGLVEVSQPEMLRVAVQVRTNSSEWNPHDALIEIREVTAWRARLRNGAITFVTRGATRWVALGACIFLLVTAVTLASARPWAKRPAPPAEMPQELDERAVLLARAVARRDLDVLVQLTDPLYRKRMRLWLANECQIKPLDAETDDPTQPAAEVRSKVQPSGDKNHFLIRVQLGDVSTTMNQRLGRP